MILVGVMAMLVAGFLLDRFVYGPKNMWLCEGGQWVRHGSPSSPSRPAADCIIDGEPRQAEQLKLADYDLSQGHLVWNSGDEDRGAWRLRFSQPSVVSFDVVFSADAECFVDGVVADCERLMLPSGSSTSMMARQEGETVIVSRLEIKTK